MAASDVRPAGEGDRNDRTMHIGPSFDREQGRRQGRRDRLKSSQIPPLGAGC